MSDCKKKKHPGGRPTKYKPEFCDIVIAVGEEGGTLIEMAEACDVHRETIRDWAKVHPEFSDAIKRSEQKAQVWWVRLGKAATIGGVEGFNPTSYIFNMKNRFRDDWRDKHEVDNTSSDGSMTPTTIERVVVMPKK